DKLGRFLEHQGGKSPVEKQDILSFIQTLKERGNSPESVNCYLRALRVFFRWAHSQELISSNPMRGIPMQKTPRLLVDILTPSDMQKVLEAIRRTGRNNLRNQAIFLLLLDTGMRPGELCNLTMEDLNLTENLVRVSGKTGERLLPISQKTRRAILSYLHVRKAPPGEKGLFLSEKGEPLTLEALRHFFAALRRRTGTRRLYPYLMRHTAATSYLREGADLETVRRLLGHTSYAVIQRYLSLTPGDLARVQRKVSPVNRLK
ncbi:MAG: tyrosine-type recombinase/integrase, partial [bacterium]